ncbi:MAG TPA: RT0821/Lpp0805 family surface protein [Burkholderiaceae bacterium]|nr:RT0821/Lpp0805 family surface protein [Burkholderiaceae bacterium]
MALQQHTTKWAPIVAAWLVALCAPALAQNWVGLLKNTPAERFNDEDLRLFLDASKKALSETPAGETVKWQNPVSGSRGELKVIKLFTWQDHPCRQIRVSNEAGDRKGSNVLNLCQVEGKWKVLSASELKKG